MTLGQLRVFLAVVRHRSINRAAAELFVTQPAVSASVTALERELGVELVAREGRGIQLTTSGEALARYAVQSLALLEQGRDAAVAAMHPGRGRLRIAAVTTAGEYVVPPIIKAFRSRFPEVEVFLEVGNRTWVFERLQERQAEVGVGGRPPDPSPFEGLPFLGNKLVVVAASNHPLARRRSIAPRQLADDVWLLREPGSGTADTTEEYLAEHGIQPSTILRLGSNGAVKQAAALGLGVTLISAQAVSLELSAGTLARLLVRGTPIRRRWFLLTLRGAFLPGPAQGLLDFVGTPTARRALRDALRRRLPTA